MSTLNTLKLVVGKRHTTASPAVHRRNKLVNKLHEQLELCEAKQAGKTYAPKQLKTCLNFGNTKKNTEWETDAPTSI